MDQEPASDIKTNPYVYPREYFDAQVAFAQRMAELTDRDLPTCLLESTALYRRITDSKVLSDHPPDLFLRAGACDTREEITEMLFGEYTAASHSSYSPPETLDDGRHFGSFIAHYHPQTHTL